MPPMPPMGPGGRKPGGPHGARLTMEKPKDAKNTIKKLIRSEERRVGKECRL